MDSFWAYLCNVGCMFYNEHEKRGPIEKNAQNSKTSCKNSSFAALEIMIIIIMLHLSFAALNVRFWTKQMFERSHLTTSFTPHNFRICARHKKKSRETL